MGIGNLIVWCIFGLIAGGLARLLVPGRDPMGCFATMALGILGSLLGGFLAHQIWPQPGEEWSAAGMIGSIIGAVILLLIWRVVVGRRRTPGL